LTLIHAIQEEVNVESAPKRSKRSKDKTEENNADDATPSSPDAVDASASVDKFRICKETKDLLALRKITALFPIQQKTFDLVYDGNDVMGRARTGTGKTLAFALPVVENLKNLVRGGMQLKLGRKPK
jgi:ATP-dependent RNA helicase DDX21